MTFNLDGKKTLKYIILAVLAMITAVCVIFIFLTAEASTLQFSINDINNKIQQAEWQQRNLEAKIKSSSNLQSLENQAKDMGLVYPSFNDIVYIGEGENSVHDLALTLRESAYLK